MSKSKIEWTDETWNVTTGCTRVSEGCDNCYAVAMTKRLANIGSTEEKYGGLVNEGKDHFNGKVKLHPDVLEEPLHWQKPRLVFVNSMSDLFHQEVPFEFIDKVFDIMAKCQHHAFQILTKRPGRMAKWFGSVRDRRPIPGKGVCTGGAPFCMGAYCKSHDSDVGYCGSPWPLPNVWIGTSVENQEAADKRIPHLLECPAAVRFLSCEPLLGPVDLSNIDTGIREHKPNRKYDRDVKTLEYVDWVITGGESGPGARPMHPDWLRLLRDQCTTVDTAFFFKQWGKWKPISEMQREEHEQYYSPRRKSDNELEQSRLIDLYGQECSIDTNQIQYDGEEGFQGIDGNASMMMFKVGKKKAGRELDGKEWNQFPEVE